MCWRYKSHLQSNCIKHANKCGPEVSIWEQNRESHGKLRGDCATCWPQQALPVIALGPWLT